MWMGVSSNACQEEKGNRRKGQSGSSAYWRFTSGVGQFSLTLRGHRGGVACHSSRGCFQRCHVIGFPPSRATARELEHKNRILSALAVEELETWMLALDRGSLEVAWAAARQHCDPREACAEPFLASSGWSTELGRGRKRAMRDLCQGWKGLLSACPEIADLKEGLRQLLP